MIHCKLMAGTFSLRVALNAGTYTHNAKRTLLSDGFVWPLAEKLIESIAHLPDTLYCKGLTLKLECV